jgi:SAM-dependent methyltransferase
VNETHLQFLASPQWAQLLEDELMPWVEAAGDLGDHVLEVGPGPGLTTDLLRQRISRVTAVELVVADAVTAGLPENCFSSAACFSILHHMPSTELQDRLFEEIYRVLRPGGIFVGQESLDLEPIRAGHADDIFTPVDPEELVRRLAAVGFRETRTDILGFHFRFAAQKPDSYGS